MSWRQAHVSPCWDLIKNESQNPQARSVWLKGALVEWSLAMQSICGSLWEIMIYWAREVGSKNCTADKDRLKKKLFMCRDQSFEDATVLTEDVAFESNSSFKRLTKKKALVVIHGKEHIHPPNDKETDDFPKISATFGCNRGGTGDGSRAYGLSVCSDAHPLVNIITGYHRVSRSVCEQENDLCLRHLWLTDSALITKQYWYHGAHLHGF